MSKKRIRRKCNCCGTWKNVFVMFGVCHCNSCFNIVYKRSELHLKNTGEYLSLSNLYKELKLEIEQIRESSTYSWS
jgi:hypothetical protein